MQSFSIIKVGPYVRPELLALFVELDMLELSHLAAWWFLLQQGRYNVISEVSL